MYAVIFRARHKLLDDAYAEMAERLRELAIRRYGCREFIALTEGDEEIAVSYWDSLEQIEAWKNDTEHLFAQRCGQSRWYRSYKVQVVEVLRGHSADLVTD